MEDNDKEVSIEWYINNRNIYKKLSSKIENIITEILDLKGISYHIITSRAKDIESYKIKISASKYDDPINQITDLAGIRIITYVEDEIDKVCNVIEEIFEIDESNSLDKSKELGIDRVGYKSVHFVAKLKKDRLELPEYNIFKDKSFEIQVRTILQHAWAEIEHDRNYKFTGKLPNEINRRFKLLAGSLEMLDREFNNIARDIDSISKLVEKGTKDGKLDFQLNSTSLKQYIETKFQAFKENNFSVRYTDSKRLFDDLESFGILTLEDLDKIVPKDYVQKVMESEIHGSKVIPQVGLITALMIINDSDKYFKKCWKEKWKIWTQKNGFENLFSSYKIDWNVIEKKYGVKFKNL
jgi:putative GTP pyrophosphokinase